MSVACDRHRGQVLVLFSLFLPVLLGAVGLAIELGFSLAQRQRMQAAADLAALGAAYCQLYPTRPVCVSAALFAGAASSAPRGMALAIARANGFEPSTVTLVTPYAGDPNRMSVRVAQPVPTRLLSIIGFAGFDISGRAVAAVQSGVIGEALLALNPTRCGAAALSGNASITINNGGMQVNSTCPTALTATGNSSVDVLAASINIAGGYSTNGNASLSPIPHTGGPPLADPLASLSPPGSAGLVDRASFSCGSNTVVTISPGIYTSITAASNCAVTMQPGVYVIKGGGVSISGNASLTGHGVFIYNSGTNFPSSGGSFGSISLTGNGAFDVDPPTTGAYAGMLIFQSRDNSRTLSMSGNGAVSGIQGTIYGPAMEVDITGNGTMPAQFIVDSVAISGNGSLTVQYTPSQVYGVPSTALVE